MDKTIYIHIGTTKTGSSALQSYLSQNPIHRLPNNRKLLYCCFDSSGKIRHGLRIKYRANRSTLKYANSDLSVFESGNSSVARKQLEKLFKRGYTPIFSQENWFDVAKNKSTLNFLTELNCKITIIAYMRPQVDWLNAIWWQWYAWSDTYITPNDYWHDTAISHLKMFYASRLNEWEQLPFANNVIARLYPEDIISDFHDLFTITPGLQPYETRNNTSLPPTLIKLLLRYKHLRNPHDSHIDIALSKSLIFHGSSPWMIDKSLSEEIINTCRKDNEALLNRLNPQSRDKMLDDPHWWNPDSYTTKHAWTRDASTLTDTELYDALDQAIPKLIRQADTNNIFTLSLPRLKRLPKLTLTLSKNRR